MIFAYIINTLCDYCLQSPLLIENVKMSQRWVAINRMTLIFYFLFIAAFLQCISSKMFCEQREQVGHDVVLDGVFGLLSDL